MAQTSVGGVRIPKLWTGRCAGVLFDRSKKNSQLSSPALFRPTAFYRFHLAGTYTPLQENILRIHRDKLTPRFKANTPMRKLSSQIEAYLSGLLHVLDKLKVRVFFSRRSYRPTASAPLWSTKPCSTSMHVEENQTIDAMQRIMKYFRECKRC